MLVAIGSAGLRSVQRLLLTMLLGCSLALASLPGSRANAQDQDPASVVRAYVFALDSGDATGAAAVFADNAIHIHPLAAGLCSRQSPCIGRAAILDDLRHRVADHYCLTLLDVSSSGSIVRGSAELRSDTLRSIGIERVLVQS